SRSHSHPRPVMAHCNAMNRPNMAGETRDAQRSMRGCGELCAAARLGHDTARPLIPRGLTREREPHGASVLPRLICAAGQFGNEALPLRRDPLLALVKLFAVVLFLL